MLPPLVFLLDSLFLLRPVVLIPVWGFCLFGYYRGAGIAFSGLRNAWIHPASGPLAWMMLFSLSVGCVYVLNQIADYEVDKKNGGLPLVASGIVSRSHAWAIAAVSGILAVLLPLFLGRTTIALLSAVTILTGWVYSFKPFYFSGRAFADFLTNAFGFGVIAFGCGWHLAGHSLCTTEFFVAALPYVLLMCAGSISSTIPDIPGDTTSRKHTTAVRLGAKNAHILASLLLIASAAIGATVGDMIVVLCAVTAVPLYLLYIVRPSVVVMESTYKIGGATCMIMAALFSPWFIGAGVATAILTWIYFRYRHHVEYPSLVPVRSSSAPGT